MAVTAKPSTCPHGTTARYHRGCRCEPCRKVKALANKQYTLTGNYVLASHPNLALKLRRGES